MRFAFGDLVEITIFTPGEPTVDPVTGNPRTSPATEETVLGLVADKSAADRELAPMTTVGDHASLVPAGTVVRSDCWFVADGKRFEVVGFPVVPRSFAPAIPWLLINLRYISDLQGEPND